MPARFWNRGHLAQSNQANAGSDWFVNLTELICWFNLWASAAGLSSHLVEDISPRRGKCTLSSTDEFGSQPHTGLGHAICCHAGGPDTGRHTNTHTHKLLSFLIFKGSAREIDISVTLHKTALHVHKIVTTQRYQEENNTWHLLLYMYWIEACNSIQSYIHFPVFAYINLTFKTCFPSKLVSVSTRTTSLPQHNLLQLLIVCAHIPKTLEWLPPGQRVRGAAVVCTCWMMWRLPGQACDGLVVL